MTWLYSIGIFVGFVLAMGIIYYLIVFICDLLNLEALDILMLILFLIVAIILIYAIHDIIFR